MALLKRLKASTLMETLVATVLIVVIFMISSMVMNNLLTNKVAKNTDEIRERLNVLEYQYKHQGYALPYFETFESWDISVASGTKGALDVVVLMAEHSKVDKSITNYMLDEDQD